MRSPLKFHLLALALARFFVSGTFADEPNVLLIIADDIAADVCNVDDKNISVVTAKDAAGIPLPGLTELANGGIRFKKAYAEPACTPTRASIYTGLHPWHSGAPHPLSHNLPQNLTTIAELTPPIYHCGLAGKWHLGDNPTDDLAIINEGVQPQFHGWDTWAGHIDGNPKPGFGKWNYWSRNQKTAVEESRYPPDLHLENLKSAITFSKNNSKPFFLTYAASLAHAPLHHPSDPGEKTDDEDFAEMVEKMDQIITALLDHLEASEMLDDTVIIFAGDNGTDSIVAVGDTTGQKLQLSDAGLRVPMIIAEGRCVRGSGGAAPAETGTWVRRKRGTAHDRPVHVVDLFLTMRDLMAKKKPELDVDSQSLYPYLQDTGFTTRTYIFSQWGGPQPSHSTWMIHSRSGVLYRLNHLANSTPAWTAHADEEAIRLTDVPGSIQNRFTAAMANYREVDNTPLNTRDNPEFSSPF